MVSALTKVSAVLFSLLAGHSAPCILIMRCTRTMCKPFVRINIQPRGTPIGVVRVGRVHVAGRVDIPHVVRVVPVSRPTETVLCTYSLQPVYLFEVFSFCFYPRLYQLHGVINDVVPKDAL